MFKEREDLPSTSPWRPSSFWVDANKYLTFIMDLSAENLQNIRLHTGFTTGASWFVHAHKTYRFLEKDEEKETIPLIQAYKYYTEGIPEHYWTDEPVTTSILEAIGVRYKDRLVSDDLLRYQSSITNLYNMGVFSFLTSLNSKPVICEIGGGYGGFAHQFHNMLKKQHTYIIIDLPEILFWSATYFMINNPKSSIYIYNSLDFSDDFFKEVIYKYDMVFLPNYRSNSLYKIRDFNLIINMLSFQEMNEMQIREYGKIGYEKLNGFIYSDNFRRHWLNKDLDKSVSSILRDYFELYPSDEVYDQDNRDELKRINCLCKYIGTNKKKPLKLNPEKAVLMDRFYEINLELQ